MKKRVSIVFFVLLACGVGAQELTVASYNIRCANAGDTTHGNGWERRAPWICKMIEFHDFDLFGAQEVLRNQLSDMSARLPAYAYIGVGRDDGMQAGEYAPVFYKRDRFDLLDEGHFWLSQITDRPNRGWDAIRPRICTWGHFYDRRTERRFWLFNLHMDHVGTVAREESAKLVVEKTRDMCRSDEFVILTGDFNVDQTSSVYSILVSSGILADSFELAEKRYAPNGTFNDFNAALWTESRIDHIFVSPSIAVRNYGVLTETYRSETARSVRKIKSRHSSDKVSLHSYEARLPSDHFPVVVRLDF